jgi:hypothetical protein
MSVILHAGNLKRIVNHRRVIVKREPSGATGQDEWCEFEERPGPAPPDAQEEDCTTIDIVYREVGIHHLDPADMAL